MLSAPFEKSDPKSFAGKLARPRWGYRQWMLAGNPAYFFERLSQDFGDFVHYRGLFSFYLVNHPALVKEVLQETHKSFDKNTIIYNRFRKVFGEGLIVAEGRQWKRQRKLMQPMFGPKTVRRFFDSMLSSTNDMIEDWKNQFGTQTVFDVANEMDQLTLKIAGQALFSNGFDGESDKIRDWTHALNQYSAKPPIPIIRDWWFPSFRNRRAKRTLREFRTFIDKLITDRRAGIERNDLLSILLTARHEDDDQPMTDHEISEEVLGMIVGAHETSASALTWIWYELNQNPEVQKTLVSEIETTVGGRSLTLDDVPNLRYTRMVIDEALRLHPPFWFENRNAMHDVELGGVTIPAGAMILFSRYSLHRHPNFWNEPECFDPTRQDPNALENSRATYAQVPFGGGPRICIGINFAILELVVILVTVVQQFRLVVSEQDRHQMAAQMTMTPKYGVKVQLEPRE